MKFFSIRTKLILILSVILLTGFFLTNVIFFRASKQSVRTSIIDHSLPLARDNIYSEIQRDLTRPIFVSSLMANDTFGHLFGDDLLKEVSQIASLAIRHNDLLIRWGGDEFVLLIFSSLEQTRQIAQRLMAAVENHDFYGRFQGKQAGEKKTITVSCGLARYRDNDSLDGWTMRADKALYRAKAKGKNCIEEASG